MTSSKTIVMICFVVAIAFCSHGDVSADVTGLLQNLSLARNMYFLVNREVIDALDDIADLIDEEVAMWVASMYDPETGGFYYARSAIGREGFSADIESTSQALRFIEHMGAYHSMPDTVRQKLIEFFQSRQDESTGYFYDPQFGSDVSNSKRSRNLSQAVGNLSKLGASPLYPLPYDRDHGAMDDPVSTDVSAGSEGGRGRQIVSKPTISQVPRVGSGRQVGANMRKEVVSPRPTAKAVQLSVHGETSHLPEYLRSASALRTWLESFDWENRPYSAGHNVGSARSEIIQVGLEDVVHEFIDEIQNPETGLWGRGRTFEEVSAAMKLSGYYSTRPFPHARKMLESTIYAIENATPTAIVFVRNPVDLISNAIIKGHAAYDPEIAALLEEHMPQIIRGAKENLLKFKQPDKGFSYTPTGSAPRSQGATVSLGLPEGDMNALMAGAHATIVYLYEIVGYPRPNLPRNANIQHFWDTIVNMEPHKPIETVLGLDEDFETGEEVPGTWRASTGSHIGTYTIAPDPYDANNRVLKVDKTDGTDGLRISRSFESKDGAEKTSISFKFMFSEFDVFGGFNFHFGATSSATNRALSFMIAQRNGDYFISHRTTSTGEGTRVSDLKPNVWYQLHIEYEPAGIDDTQLTIYLDGEPVQVLSEFYNGGNEAKQPVSNVSYVEFYGFISVTATLYVDDLKVSAQ